MSEMSPDATAFRTTPGALPADLQAGGEDGAFMPTSALAPDAMASSGTTGESSPALQPIYSVAESLDATLQRGQVWLQGCRDEVRANPLAAVALAFVAGMLFDRSRRPRRSSRTRGHPR